MRKASLLQSELSQITRISTVSGVNDTLLVFMGAISRVGCVRTAQK